MKKRDKLKKRKECRTELNRKMKSLNKKVKTKKKKAVRQKCHLCPVATNRWDTSLKDKSFMRKNREKKIS